MPDGPVVQTHELTKRYGDFTALDSLSIRLNRGQILGFIGPNGAGKTTTIKVLVGLAKPTSGWAKIAGIDCERESKKIKKLVGYMPDTFGSYDNMRVREYLDFFGAAYKIHRGDREKRIDEVMDITGTHWLKDRYCEALSHGMKQRVGIARTLLHDPEVLIFDEPANGLDPAARIEMRKILLRLAEMGKTLIVTSHILPELSRICDVVAIITHGKLRAFGSLDDIMRQISQQRTFEVQLLGGDEAVLEQAARVIREAENEESTVTASPAEAMVRFTTTRDDEALAALLGKLVASGIGVAQYREVVQDLEDAFMSVTRQDDADAEHMHVGAIGSARDDAGTTDAESSINSMQPQQAAARYDDLDTQQSDHRQRPLSILEVLFSFSGRICRTEYWLKGQIYLIAFGLVNNILVYGVNVEGFRALAVILGLASVWPATAILIKRWHDRDHSAWWLLTLLIPYLNLIFMIWIIVEVWFMKGTNGPNRFGEDPLLRFK